MLRLSLELDLITGPLSSSSDDKLSGKYESQNFCTFSYFLSRWGIGFYPWGVSVYNTLTIYLTILEVEGWKLN